MGQPQQAAAVRTDPQVASVVYAERPYPTGAHAWHIGAIEHLKRSRKGEGVHERAPTLKPLGIARPCLEASLLNTRIGIYQHHQNQENELNE
ncbi:MAG: hypothetical protein MUC50_14070 [Myxococcota bacterium]|jgi:hypothetical protein|nr:hypothetical protein [Myxococcota bacterium]